ncbi:MAG TPA: hypothetical protein VMF30_14880 [Pirellulales bacterium]|nr:hypothetical protein [Pirellulales bacterium]
MISVMNLLDRVPSELVEEAFEPLVQGEHLLVERIVSRGHVTPEGTWLAADRHEWSFCWPVPLGWNSRVSRRLNYCPALQ